MDVPMAVTVKLAVVILFNPTESVPEVNKESVSVMLALSISLSLFAAILSGIIGH